MSAASVAEVEGEVLLASPWEAEGVVSLGLALPVAAHVLAAVILGAQLVVRQHLQRRDNISRAQARPSDKQASNEYKTFAVGK